MVKISIIFLTSTTLVGLSLLTTEFSSSSIPPLTKKMVCSVTLAKIGSISNMSKFPERDYKMMVNNYKLAEKVTRRTTMTILLTKLLRIGKGTREIEKTARLLRNE